MPPAQTVQTIRNQVYQILKKQICSGEYPPRFWLQEQELAASLQVSRSPVREALRRLVADGLADEIPNKGVFVRSFSAQDIEEIFEIRTLLEGYAIRKGHANYSPQQQEALLKLLQELETAHTAGDLELYTQLDDKLHLTIVQWCGNQLAAEMYGRVHSMVRQFRIYSLTASVRFQDSLSEHRGVVEALLQGDWERAEEINRTHLELANRQILNQLVSAMP